MEIENLKRFIVDYPQLSVNNRGELVVEETSNKSVKNTLKKITLTRLEENATFSLKFDHYQQKSKFFKIKEKDINKGCDVIVIIQNENGNFIFICELKSHAFKEKYIANKFFVTIAFLKYLNELLERFYNESIVNFDLTALTFYLKKKQRLKKFSMRSKVELEFENKSYSNGIKTIQVLEVSRYSPNNFHVSLENIHMNNRPKKLKDV